MLIEMNLIKEILRITCTILRDNFFYTEQMIGKFLSCLEIRMIEEYVNVEETIEEGYRTELKYNYDSRHYFTSYFASNCLHESLVEDFHFNSAELDLFQSIISKHTGEIEDGHESSEQGTCYRKLFEEL